MVDGRSYGDESLSRRARDGAQDPNERSRLGASLGPWFAVCKRRVPKRVGIKRDRVQHESARKLLGCAVAESFFGTIKNELIYRRPWLDRESAKEAISEYIEVFYNRIRQHSTIGYVSPAKFEEMNQAEAAQSTCPLLRSNVTVGMWAVGSSLEPRRKQMRPGPLGIRAHFFTDARDPSYPTLASPIRRIGSTAYSRRPAAARPARPRPMSRAVPGSGTTVSSTTPFCAWMVTPPARTTTSPW